MFCEASKLHSGGREQATGEHGIDLRTEWALVHWSPELRRLPTEARASVEPHRTPYGALCETQQEEEGQKQVTPVGSSPPRRERQGRCFQPVQVQFLLPVTIRYIIPSGGGTVGVVSFTQKNPACTGKEGSLLTVMFWKVSDRERLPCPMPGPWTSLQPRSKHWIGDGKWGIWGYKQGIHLLCWPRKSELAMERSEVVKRW